MHGIQDSMSKITTKIIVLVVSVLLFECVFFAVGGMIALGPPLNDYFLVASDRQIKTGVYGSDNYMGFDFEARIISGTVYSEKVELFVRQTSKSYDGPWLDWRDVIRASYIVDDRGNRTASDESSSRGWSNGNVRPGGYREGSLSFPVNLPAGTSSLVLHFGYVPNAREIQISIPITRPQK